MLAGKLAACTLVQHLKSGPRYVPPLARCAGVLVARHGPLLANAVFLPPGALVLELLPYNW